MKKIKPECLQMTVICPVCKQKVKFGEMMCGTSKPICKYCYEKEKGGVQK